MREFTGYLLDSTIVKVMKKQMIIPRGETSVSGAGTCTTSSPNRRYSSWATIDDCGVGPGSFVVTETKSANLEDDGRSGGLCGRY